MKKGFTLIELLAVIVVISVLITLTTVSITRTVKNSKNSLYNTQIKSIQSAAEQYGSENLDFMPKADSTNTTIINYFLLSDIQESGILDKNIKNPKTKKIFTDNDLVIKVTSSYITKYKTSKLKYEVITDKEEIVSVKERYEYSLSNEESQNVGYATLIYANTFNANLKALSEGDLNNEKGFNRDVYNDKINSISFLKPGKVPAGYTKETLMLLDKVDVSANNDNSILALWDGQGNIYIYSEFNVKLNSINSGAFMFMRLRTLKTIDFSNFDTSEATNMQSMFVDCHSLISLDLSSFDTSNVTHMNSMFFNDIKLKSVDLSSFDTSKVIYMNGMFGQCRSLDILNLSNFNTSNVIGMNSMFELTTNLSNVYVGDGWITTNADTTDMFKNSQIQSVMYK